MSKYRQKKATKGWYDSHYYKTEDWIDRSLMLIEDANYTCEKCKRKFERKYLSIHHKTYEYKPHEEPDDALQCLCKDCHYVIHEVQKIVHEHRSRNIHADCINIEDHHEKEIVELLKKSAPWILDGEEDFLTGKIVFSRIKKKFYDFIEKTETPYYRSGQWRRWAVWH